MKYLYFFFLFCWTGLVYSDGGEARIDFLLDRLEKANDFKVKIAAAQELGRTADGTVVDWMLKAFAKESNVSVRLATLSSIAKIPDHRVLAPVIFLTQESMLKDSEILTIERIVWTFRKAIDVNAWEKQLLTSKDSKLRGISAWLLGLSGSTRAIPNLKIATKDHVNTVKQRAYRSLGLLGHEKEAQFCKLAAQKEKQRSVKNVALLCMAWIKMKSDRTLPPEKNPFHSLNDDLRELMPKSFTPQTYTVHASNHSGNTKLVDALNQMDSQHTSERQDRRIPLMEPQDVFPTMRMSASVMADMEYYAQDVAVLRSTLKLRAKDVDDCYHQRLEDKAKIEGDLLLAVTILGSGKVDSVKYLENSLTDKTLRSCVQSVVKSTAFPNTGFKSVTINYQFSFFPPKDQRFDF